MIKNILFDMGNVLLRFTPETFLTGAGITDEEDRALLMREVFRSIDWVMLDRGTLTDGQAVQRMCARLPERLHGTVRTLVCEWDAGAGLVPGMEALVKELSEAGYGLYLLTNAALRHRSYWSTFSVSRYFGDRIMLSADWKLLKPEAAFFEKAVELFSLNRDECLFIDDWPPNAEAAVRSGIDAVVFHGEALLRKELKSRGILA